MAGGFKSKYFQKLGNGSCYSLKAQAQNLAKPHFYHILCLRSYREEESQISLLSRKNVDKFMAIFNIPDWSLKCELEIVGVGWGSC